MDHLHDIPVEELQRALDEVEGKKPAQRLIAAIAYKNGVTQTELAEWYDVQRRTIYNWLMRLDEEPIERAVRDDPRSGRPRKLTAEQRERLHRTLKRPPEEAGYDAESWTARLVSEYVKEAFGVDYSRSTCRRLLREKSE